MIVGFDLGNGVRGVMGTGFEFKVLGPLEVTHHGVPVAIAAAKQRVLLASLLMDANRVVPVETLMARLWGDAPPGGAGNTLQNYVLRLRRALMGAGEPLCPVLTRPGGYVINVRGDALDLHRFDGLAHRARIARAAGDAEQASELLRQALRLWRGEPLSGLPSELLQREVVPALAERRLGAVELRIEVDLGLGRHVDVLPELRELTMAHPLRERFWAQRMLALYRAGRQAEALECYRSISELLIEELGVDPGAELRELHQRVLSADPALSDAVSSGGIRHARNGHARATGDLLPRDGGLPAEMTTFIGRERQLAEARRLLEITRLVTLTGAGGVGKTRLAVRVAATAGEAFPDGVWLADLAPLAEPELLDRAVAQAVGVRDQSARPGADVLVEHLRGKRLLLVLDNCEHVVDAVAALLVTILRAAPGLHVLATSRQRLGVPGEHALLVPPLSVPPPSRPPSVPGHQDIGPPPASYEAVRLLVDRAAASAAEFQITADNLGAVTQLCQRLDGIPLAIELAAVRLSMLSIEEILERLDDRFRLLTHGDTQVVPHYHRTLRGVVDWSHDLCTEHERRLWAQLSVFSGGFDLTAAETVCAGEGVAREEILDLVAGLVHKSIVVAGHCAHQTRYRLLETIRQYGLHRLRDLGQNTSLRRRHRDYYHAMAAQAAADWYGPREVERMSQLREELPNLRVALDHCITQPGQAGSGLEIAMNLTRTRCWFFNSTLGEGRHWLGRALALYPRRPDPLRIGATALRAWIALCQGDRHAADRFLAECRDLARQFTDDVVPAVLYIEGAHAFLVRGDAQAIPLLARARDRLRDCGEIGDAHMTTMLWAMAVAFHGDHDTAVAAGDEYLADAEASGADWAYSWALWGRGLTEARHGDPQRAAVLLRDSLRRQRDIEDSWGPVWGVEVLAWTIAATGRHEQAARLLGAAHRMRQSTGVTITGLRPFHDAHAEAEGVLRHTLGPRAYATAFDVGACAEDAIGLALDG